MTKAHSTLGRMPQDQVCTEARVEGRSAGERVSGARGLNDGADGVQDRLRLLVRNVVAAPGRDHQPAARHQLGRLGLQLAPQPLVLLDRPARWRRVGVAVSARIWPQTLTTKFTKVNLAAPTWPVTSQPPSVGKITPLAWKPRSP
jgi:hypothetical protein